MLLFLINVDDVPLQIPQASFAALFVDDLSGIWSSHDVSTLSDSVVSDFSSLYNWSIQNQQIFSSEKFQMLNLGRHISRADRDNMTFNGQALEWDSKATFLGVIFDSLLSFRPEMEARLKRMNTNSWRVFQFSSPIDGLDAGTLNVILTYHIKSILAYGSHLWIFRAFPTIESPTQTASRGYGGVWNRMNTVYHKLLRAILGAKSGSSRIGVLVRGGGLPLHYELALRGLTMFFKIQLNKSGDAMDTQYTEFKQDEELWERTRIYEPCERIIQSFDAFTEEGTPDLLSLGCVQAFKRELKRAMFSQLSVFWSSYPGCDTTRKLFPVWESRFLTPYNVSRWTESFYYRLAFTQNDLRPFLHSIQRARSDKCRACHDCPETTSHILLSCPCYKHQRKRLSIACAAHNLEFNEQSLLASPEIKHATEMFLKTTILATVEEEMEEQTS